MREEPQPVLEGLAVRRMQEVRALRQAQGVQGVQEVQELREVRRRAPQPEAQAVQLLARAVRQFPRQPPQVYLWG